jgi:hypothetical protein
MNKNLQDAINAIKEVEVLYDIKKSTHWKLLYEPTFGKLEKFIEKHQIKNIICVNDKLKRFIPMSKVTEFLTNLDINSLDDNVCFNVYIRINH